jgi:hypothetical protein
MINSFKKFFKTALYTASFFSVSSALLLGFTACGNLGPDPDADGARFNRSYNYYYVQICSYNTVSYDVYLCSDIEGLDRPKHLKLRVDSDGFAKLEINGDPYTYMESEYSEGYDSEFGSFFHFYQDDDELTVYKDGLTLAYWNSFDGTVTYYYYDFFYF